jgi:2-polyprenyl-3-methyl-5-hydroxy-6-metoxy-1,4-benzoquinol methylase
MILAAHAPNLVGEKATALDIGCGNGQISWALKSRFGLDVACTDITNFLEHDLPFYPISNDRFEFAKDKQFDYAFLNDVLHHIPFEPQLKVVREAARVARRVLIFETQPTLRAKVLDMVMNHVVYGGKEVVTLTHRKPEAWFELLTAAGLVCSVTPLPSPLFYYPLNHFSMVVHSPE